MQLATPILTKKNIAVKNANIKKKVHFLERINCHNQIDTRILKNVSKTRHK